jgi:hypothetical protein
MRINIQFKVSVKPTAGRHAMNPLPPDFIPSRHRRSEGVEAILGKLHRVMPAVEAPDAARWNEIGAALMQGDPAMDRLLEVMTRHGLREARAQFETALRLSIEAVPNALPELREFMAEVTTPPPWLDRARLERGAELFRRCGRTAFQVGRDVALMGGYQASAFNRTLILTSALQKGPTRRLAETVQWNLDCTAAGGMAPHAGGWRSTLMVRFIHALVRRSVAARADWRMADWGLPINQPDMAATLYGTLTVPVLGSRLMGMPQTRRERDDLAHLARYVGWLIGVNPRWLADTEEDSARQLLHLLLSLNNPDETGPLMARPLAEEPLTRPYPNLAWLRGPIERSRHLSISRAFLGREAMERLGLPAVLPWYPVAAFPLNLLRHAVSRVVPGGLVRAERMGRAAQEAEARSYILDRPAVVGESVAVPH